MRKIKGNDLRISVHSAKKEIYSEIGDEYWQESQNGVYMEESGITEAFQTSAVESECIYQKSYECPGFFRVPWPIVSPGDICPYCPKKNAECK